MSNTLGSALRGGRRGGPLWVAELLDGARCGGTDGSWLWAGRSVTWRQERHLSYVMSGRSALWVRRFMMA
jgi:hypothetical protein